MAEKNFPADEEIDEIIDLTELIETGTAAKSAGSAAYSKAAQAPADDFASYLGDLDDDDSPAVNADEKLDMSGMGDIENLLDSFDIPAQTEPEPKPAAAAPAAPKPKEAAEPDDLDSLLDDLLEGGDASKAKKAPPEAKPAQKVAPKPAPEPLDDLDADLNSILQEAGEISQPENSGEDGLAPGDLDALDMPETAPQKAVELSELDLEIEEPGQALDKDTEDPVPDLGDFDDLLQEQTSSSQQADISAPIDPNVNVETEESKDLPRETHGPYPAQPVMEQGLRPDVLANICNGIVSAQSHATEEVLRDFSHKLGFQAGQVEELARRMDEFGAGLKEKGAELDGVRERLAVLEKSVDGNATLESLFTEGTALNNGFMQLIAAVVGKALENGAPRQEDSGALTKKVTRIEENFSPLQKAVASLEERIGDLENAGKDAETATPAFDPAPLLEKIESLETRLADMENVQEQQDSAAREQALADVAVRLAGLEEKSAALAASLDNGAGRLNMLESEFALSNNFDTKEIMARLDSMEGQEAGFLAKFAGMEGRLDSLESGLGDATLKVDQIAGEELGSRLRGMDKLEKSLNARMDALEKRLDSLEPKFNAEVEKVAAKAVAKILHEEIARLLAGN